MEALVARTGGGLTSARWRALDALGAPRWLYVSFDLGDRVLGHALIPRDVEAVEGRDGESTSIRGNPPPLGAPPETGRRHDAVRRGQAID